MSATAGLPRLDQAAAAAADLQSGVTGVLDVVRSVSTGSGDDPLGILGEALGGLESILDLDMASVTEQLPRTITTIRNALPTDSLRYVEAIEAGYQQVTGFLADSELVQAVRDDAGVQETALRLVDGVLDQFQARLTELASGLVSAEDLAAVRDGLALLEHYQSDAIPPEDLLPLLSQQLIGVADDLLTDPLAAARSVLDLVEPLAASVLSEQLAPAQDAVAASVRDLAEAIAAFDPADVALYARLEVKVQGLHGALDEAFDVLEAVYAAAGEVIDDPAWDAVLPAYTAALNTVPVSEIPTVDDVVEQIAGVLNDLLARLTMALSPEDVATRIAGLAARLRSTFAQSPLGQVRAVILDFLATVRETIEQVPTEQVQQAVTAMLERIRQELDALGITTIRSSLEQGFHDAQTFMDEQLDAELLASVQKALQDVLREVEALPIEEVGQRLTEAVDALGGVVGDLTGALQSGLEDARALLERLDEVSFRPVADEVLEEIKALETRLRQIKPESLSDAERLAIQAGLVLLRAVDLDGMIENQLKTGFAEVADQLRALVDRVVAAWTALRSRLDGFNPEVVLGPLTGLVEEVTGDLRRLNGATLLAPLYDQLRDLEQHLEKLSPGTLLDPLTQPYEQMMAAVRRIDPDVWVQPLRSLHAEIDRLLGHIDITPLLDTLDGKQRELFVQARDAVRNGLDAIDLPPPLDAFYEQVTTVALAVTDTLFDDPDAGLRETARTVHRNVKPSSLFLPLDKAFDQLLRLLDEVPRDELVAVMETLRRGLGAALPALDPRRVREGLREGQARFAALSPVRVAAAIPTLPALQVTLAARLEVAPEAHAEPAAALRARVGLVVSAARPDLADSRLQRLQVAHEALAARLRQRINELDTAAAQAAYARLEAHLGRLLPAFLRQSEPLTYQDVRAGLAALRPSLQARRLDEDVERFLNSLRPLQGALEESTNGLFRTVREAVLLLDPGTLKEAVADVYDSLRDKVHVLDPDELAGALRENVYEPLLDPLEAMDPAAIKAQVDGLYRNLVSALTGGVTVLLDEVKQAVDRLLASLRQALTGVLTALQAQVARLLQTLRELLGDLDTLLMDDLLGRLRNVIDSVDASFDRELGRVRQGFHGMLNAIPLQPASSSAAVSR